MQITNSSMLQKILQLIILIITGLLLANCNQAPPVEAEAPKGVLRLVTVPTDMSIFINGQPKGNSPSGPGQYFQILLEEGEHNIEVLKPVDEEKEMYGDKTIFIAADTVQTVTVESKLRLTPFGEGEKARRESEAAEKARLAEIERKKAAEIAAEEKRLRETESKRLQAIEEKRLATIRAPFQEYIGKYFTFKQNRTVNSTEYNGYYIGKIIGFSGEKLKIDLKTANCRWDPRYPCNIEILSDKCTGNTDISMYKKRRPSEIILSTSCITSNDFSFLTNEEIIEAKSKNWYSRF